MADYKTFLRFPFIRGEAEVLKKWLMESWPSRQLSDYLFESLVVATESGSWLPSPDDVIGVVVPIKQGFSAQRYHIQLEDIPFEGTTIGHILKKEPDIRVHYGGLCMVDSRSRQNHVGLALSLMFAPLIFNTVPGTKTSD